MAGVLLQAMHVTKQLLRGPGNVPKSLRHLYKDKKCQKC